MKSLFAVGFIGAAMSVGFSAEQGKRYTLKGPAPTPAIHSSSLHVAAGVTGTLSSKSAEDTLSPKGLHWETGALLNLDKFSLYGSAAFKHGIGSAIYTILTDSSSQGALQKYRYGSPSFSLELLKDVVDSRPFSLTLGVGGSVGFEFGKQFLDKNIGGSTSGTPSDSSGPFSGTFFGTAQEEFESGGFSWGMYQRIHWNWSESKTVTTESGFRLVEQGFTTTIDQKHRIHAALGVQIVREPLADLYYPLSVAVGYTWIGRLKK